MANANSSADELRSNSRSELENQELVTNLRGL